MCGRYGLVIKPDTLKERYDVKVPLQDFSPKYNIAPGAVMPVITQNGNTEVALMRWGLIPSWAKDINIGYKMINARCETVHEKPAYKKAFAENRCLVPATGFFEWKKYEDTKIPYFVQMKGEKVFSFAGLFDTWIDTEGGTLQTYTILTTEPNDILSPIHNRMPVILDKETENIWMEKERKSEVLQSLFAPFPSSKLDVYPVSKLVNNPDNDSKEILERVEEISQDALF